MASKSLSKFAIFAMKLLIIGGIMGSVFLELPIFQKSIAISVDGIEEEVKVNGLYASDLIAALDSKLGNENYILNETVNTTSFISDINKLGIKTKKNVKINLLSGGQEHKTYVATLKDLLTEAGLNYKFENQALLNEYLTSEFVLDEKLVEESYAVEIIENAELEEGKENIVQEGRNKQISELYASKTTVTEKIGTKIVDEGSTKIIEKGTKPAPKASTAPAVANGSVWDQLAFCESGGRWNVNTGNGYYGGLQFSAATWKTASRAVGLDIEYAHLATREEQIMAATWLQERSGWGQWPHCSKKLGLI